jgi:ribosomal protein L37AE/L43A
MDEHRCPNCKKPMMAMTDRTGRTQLRCLKCDKVGRQSAGGTNEGSLMGKVKDTRPERPNNAGAPSASTNSPSRLIEERGAPAEAR